MNHDKSTDADKCQHPNCTTTKKALAPFSDNMVNIIANSRTSSRIYMTTTGHLIEPTLTIGYKCHSCKRVAVGITLMPQAELNQIFDLMESGALSQITPKECQKCNSKILNCFGWAIDSVGQAKANGFEHAKRGDSILLSIYYELNKNPLILYATFIMRDDRIEVAEDDHVADFSSILASSEMKVPGLPWPVEGTMFS